MIWKNIKKKQGEKKVWASRERSRGGRGARRNVGVNKQERSHKGETEEGVTRWEMAKHVG